MQLATTGDLELVGAVAFFAYPLLNEGTKSSCKALERRALTLVAMDGGPESLIIGALARHGDGRVDEGLAERLMRREQAGDAGELRLDGGEVRLFLERHVEQRAGVAGCSSSIGHGFPVARNVDAARQWEQVAEAVRESGHSAFPVATEDLDDVDGVLLVNDLFRSSNRRRGFGVALPDISEIERKIRQPFVLPETMEVFEALEEMRKNHRTFAIVVDEHGGVAGVVSTRDLLEPLVGDLSDEYDEEEADEISLISTGRWLIQGQVHVDTVEEVTGIALPEGEYVTISGFLMEQFDKVPTQGEVLTWRDWTFTVYRTEKRRVLEVIVAAAPPIDDKSPSGEGVVAE